MTGTKTDYSKEAVRRRFAERHRGGELRARPVAWLLDAVALVFSAFVLFRATQGGLPPLGTLAGFGMVVLLPILVFVAARFVKPVPTVLGWLWLGLMGLVLIATVFGLTG